jgi:uncharacterized protein with GYD domain
MFGQYDGAAVFNLPDSQFMAAVSLAITSARQPLRHPGNGKA